MNTEQVTQRLSSILDELEKLAELCWDLTNNPEQLKDNLYTAICSIEKSIEEIDPDYFDSPAFPDSKKSVAEIRYFAFELSETIGVFISKTFSEKEGRIEAEKVAEEKGESLKVFGEISAENAKSAGF